MTFIFKICISLLKIYVSLMFQTSLKISKVTNCFKLSIKCRGSRNLEARARYRSSHNRSKRLDIITKHRKTRKRFLTDKRECFNKYTCSKKLIRRYSGNGLVAKRKSQNFSLKVNEYGAATQAYCCAISKIFLDTLSEMAPNTSDIEQKIRTMSEKNTQVYRERGWRWRRLQIRTRWREGVRATAERMRCIWQPSIMRKKPKLDNDEQSSTPTELRITSFKSPRLNIDDKS